MAAVPDHVETSVPFCGQAHLECDLRRKHTRNAAVRRNRIGSLNHRGRNLRDVLRLELAQSLAHFAGLHVRFRIIHERTLELGKCLTTSRRADGCQEKSCAYSEPHGMRAMHSRAPWF